MKFEKLSLDKFDSHAMSNDSLFKIVGGVKTTYTVLNGPHAGETGTDTRDGLSTTITSGPYNGKTDKVVSIQGIG